MKQKRNTFLHLTTEIGTVLPTNDFVKGENATGNPIKYYYGGGIEFGWQTMGDKLWEQVNGLPYFGIGLSNIDFFNTPELGTPSSLYGFYSAPIKTFKKWSIDYNLGFGLAFNWEHYDMDLNPNNFAIGSDNTVYVDARIVADFPIRKHFNIQCGFSVSHFSNGAASLPNLGINLLSAEIALRYNFNKERPKFENWKIPKYNDDNEFLFSLSMGTKQIKYDTSLSAFNQKFYDVDYIMSTMSFVYHRQLNYSIKVGAGLDLSYNGTFDALSYVNGETQQLVNSPFIDKMELGVIGSFEWVIARLSVLIQPGYRVLRKEIKGQIPSFYQRTGVKYHFLPNIFAGIYIRAHDFSVSDYIEWTIGYRMKWK